MTNSWTGNDRNISAGNLHSPLIFSIPSLAAVTKLGASAEISHRYLPWVLRFTFCRNTDFLVDLRTCKKSVLGLLEVLSQQIQHTLTRK